MSQRQNSPIADKHLSDDFKDVLLQHILDMLPCGIQLLKAVTDANGTIINFDIVFSNRKAKDFLQLPTKKLMFPKKITTNADKLFFKSLSRVIETGTTITAFNERNEKSQGLNYFEQMSKYASDGVMVIYEDFSQHKEIFDKLQIERQQMQTNEIPTSAPDNGASEKKELLKVIKSETVSLDHFVQSITQALPDILFIMDLNSYELLFANRKVTEILGYTKEMVDKMQNIFLDIMHPEDLPIMLKHLEEMKTAADGEVREIEYRLVHANGTFHWFIDRNTVFKRDENGVPVEKIGISHDITSTKAAEGEIYSLNSKLLSKNRELEGVNSELQTFTNIAANDYKETLKNLYTNLEFLIANDAKNISNSGKANIRKAQNAIQKMKLLTEDIVSFSKIPHLDNQMRATDLNEVLEAVINDMKDKVADSNASITSDALPTINGFPLLLSLLFYHLIDNAIKFRDKKEAPEIRITYKKSKSSLISQNTVYHKITISDKGIGFEQKLAPQLFEIFYRIHDKQLYRGSGIGLAVCKKIMDLHGGMILAQAHEHKGSDFCCFFPISND